MKRPVVSVILPTYNRPVLTREAVTSVLRQSYSNFELIIVDDGSKTPLELPPDERVSLISSRRTGRPGAARDIGVKKASGALISFLDSDDLYLPEKLEIQLASLRERRCRFSHTLERWERNGRVMSQKKLTHKRQGDIFEYALKKCIIGPSTVMMERQLYIDTGGFRKDLEIAEDYEYWLRITDSLHVDYVDSALTIKRAGDWDNLSEKYGHIESCRIRGLKDLVDNKVFSEDHQKMAEKVLAEKCVIHARGAEKRGKKHEADAYYELARNYENRGPDSSFKI